MRNANHAFGILIRSSSRTHHLLLVFHRLSEIRKKLLRVRYADFLTLQSIFKGTVHMN